MADKRCHCWGKDLILFPYKYGIFFKGRRQRDEAQIVIAALQIHAQYGSHPDLCKHGLVI